MATIVTATVWVLESLKKSNKNTFSQQQYGIQPTPLQGGRLFFTTR